MSFFLAYWRWIVVALLAAVISWEFTFSHYREKLAAQAEQLTNRCEAEKTVALKMEHDACKKSLEQTNAFQASAGLNDTRARVLTRRVYSATCGDLSPQPAKASGEDRGDGTYCLDRENMAELIERGRRCDNNTVAAKTLDDAWK